MTSKRGGARTPNNKPGAKKNKPSSLLTTDYLIVIGSIIVMILIVAGVIYAVVQDSYRYSGEVAGVENFPSLVASHVTTPVNYQQTPPAGGPHDPKWQTCGVYTEPLRNEHAVHSMEHGTVWITYQPDLPADQVQTLQNITRQSSHRLLSPYVNLDSPIILSAWGYQLRLDSASDPRLMQFLSTYEEAATTPELGATCSGGETRTLGQLQ